MPNYIIIIFIKPYYPIWIHRSISENRLSMESSAAAVAAIPRSRITWSGNMALVQSEIKMRVKLGFDHMREE